MTGRDTARTSTTATRERSSTHGAEGDGDGQNSKKKTFEDIPAFEEIFAMFDTDRDGQITTEDVVPEFLDTLKVAAQEVIHQVGYDGVITRNDFKKWWYKGASFPRGGLVKALRSRHWRPASIRSLWDLKDVLHRGGVDVEAWGLGKANGLYDLWTEVQNGESRITVAPVEVNDDYELDDLEYDLDAPERKEILIRREVDYAQIRIYRKEWQTKTSDSVVKNRVLVEGYQGLPDGRWRKKFAYMSQPVQLKEVLLEAATRALQEQLNATELQLTVTVEKGLDPCECLELVSPVYPGLDEFRRIHDVAATVEGLPEHSFMTRQADGPVVIHCWEYMDTTRIQAALENLSKLHENKAYFPRTQKVTMEGSHTDDNATDAGFSEDGGSRATTPPHPPHNAFEREGSVSQLQWGAQSGTTTGTKHVHRNLLGAQTGDQRMLSKRMPIKDFEGPKYDQKLLLTVAKKTANAVTFSLPSFVGGLEGGSVFMIESAKDCDVMIVKLDSKNNVRAEVAKAELFCREMGQHAPAFLDPIYDEENKRGLFGIALKTPRWTRFAWAGHMELRTFRTLYANESDAYVRLQNAGFAQLSMIGRQPGLARSKWISVSLVLTELVGETLFYVQRSTVAKERGQSFLTGNKCIPLHQHMQEYVVEPTTSQEPPFRKGTIAYRIEELKKHNINLVSFCGRMKEYLQIFEDQGLFHKTYGTCMVHGEMDGHSILVDKQQQVKLFNFTKVDRQHVFYDLARLEVTILCELITIPASGPDFDGVVEMIESLARDNNSVMALSKNVPHNAHFAYKTVMHLRSYVRHFFVQEIKKAQQADSRAQTPTQDPEVSQAWSSSMILQWTFSCVSAALALLDNPELDNINHQGNLKLLGKIILIYSQRAQEIIQSESAVEVDFQVQSPRMQSTFMTLPPGNRHISSMGRSASNMSQVMDSLSNSGMDRETRSERDYDEKSIKDLDELHMFAEAPVHKRRDTSTTGILACVSQRQLKKSNSLPPPKSVTGSKPTITSSPSHSQSQVSPAQSALPTSREMAALDMSLMMPLQSYIETLVSHIKETNGKNSIMSDAVSGETLDLMEQYVFAKVLTPRSKESFFRSGRDNIEEYEDLVKYSRVRIDMVNVVDFILEGCGHEPFITPTPLTNLTAREKNLATSFTAAGATLRNDPDFHLDEEDIYDDSETTVRSHVLVCGVAASGKTTLFRKLNLQATISQTPMSGIKPRVPIMISIVDLVDVVNKVDKSAWTRNSNLVDIYMQYKHGHRDSDLYRFWVSSHELGVILLLLDGLDEVDEGKVECIAQYVNSYFHKHGRHQCYDANGNFICDKKETNHQVAISSRPKRIKMLQQYFGDYSWSVVLPLTRLSMENIARARLTKAGPMIKQIANNKDLTILARSPLLFCLLIHIYRKDETELPKKKSVLYDLLLGTLVRNLKEEKKRGEDALDVRECTEFLQYIAYDRHCVHAKRDIPGSEAEALEERWIKARGKEPETKNLWLTLERAIQSGNFPLLPRVEVDLGSDPPKGIYRFAHLTFQEYMAAVHIVAQLQKDLRPKDMWKVMEQMFTRQNPFDMMFESTFHFQLIRLVVALMSDQTFTKVVGVLTSSEATINMLKSVCRIIVNERGVIHFCKAMMKLPLSLAEWLPVKLDFENMSLSQNDLESIADMMTENSTVKFLNLRLNPQCQDKGAKFLGSMIAVNETIEDLNLGSSEVGAEGIMELAKGIKVNKSLKYLNLELNSIHDRKKHNSNLVDHRERGYRAMQLLSEAFKENSSVSMINLNDNLLCDPGLAPLGHALASNMTVTEVYVRGNRVGDATASSFAEALKSEASSLRILDFYNNMITGTGAKKLAKALQQSTKLENLNLGKNKIGSEGMSAIMKALQTNKSLSTLNVEMNSIGPEGFTDFAETLRVNTTLTHVHARANHANHEGAQEIANLLANNNNMTLQFLNFSVNDVSETAGSLLRHVQQKRAQPGGGHMELVI